jgi:hypothetical protein
MYSYFSKTAKRKQPVIWDEVVEETKSGDKYGIPGQWNARKASRAVQLYKERGGEYLDDMPSPENNSLKKWLAEDWTTYDGSPAIQRDIDGNVITVNRYLPAAAWKQLSPGQVGATNRAKRQGFKQGKQFVSNAKAAKKAGAEARNFSYMTKSLHHY